MTQVLPPSLQPILEAVRAKIPAKNVPLDFWQIESDPKILNGFMDLAPRLMQSDLDEIEVPRGYVLLAHLFDWEADCQFDGWGAFKNVSHLEFDRICSYYGEVGLEGEAVSLRHQMSVFRQNPDDQDALVQAASLHRHTYSGDLDRLEYLTQSFCDHASELLYAGA